MTLKKYKRDDFVVLVPADSVEDAKPGEGGSTGVQPYPPKSKDSKSDKTNKGGSKDSKSDDNSQSGSGEVESGSGKELKPQGSGSGKATSNNSKGSSSIDKITNIGPGGIIDADTSRKLQEDAGVEVEVPTQADIDKMKEIARKNIGRLNADDKSARGSIGGSGNGSLKTYLEELLFPKVDWKRELKKFIGKIFSGTEEYIGNKRHIHKEEYLTGDRDIEDGLHSAVVAVDVSGSLMADFIELVTEVVEISRARFVKKIHVLPFAHDVHDEITIKKGQKITGETFKDVTLGGGTEAIPNVINWINKNLHNNFTFCVILTDGYLTNGLPKPPIWGRKTIWVVYENTNFHVPAAWGKVVHVKFQKTLDKG